MIIRNDNNYDLYTYKICINELQKENINYFTKYHNFYFINASCIGPFIPPILDNNWIELFNNKLKNYDLIGPIVEFPADNLGYKLLGVDNDKNIPFIHTYMFGMSKNGFNLLKILFETLNNDKIEMINMERKITSFLLMNNLKITTLLLRFKNIDLNDSNNWNYKYFNNNTLSCYEVPDNYFGIDINPFEVIFVKNVRNVNETRIIKHSNISNRLKLELDNYTSWY